MANFYYTDANGQKQGPVNENQLKALAAKGAITPETPLETEGGHKGVAGQVPGLDFSSGANALPLRPQDTFAWKAGVLAKKAGVGGVFSWLFDFPFHDIRLPIINLWVGSFMQLAGLLV